MILTEIFANVRDIPDLKKYHVETCMVKSDDLHKKILRLKTDHGNEYGVRLLDGEAALGNGVAFKAGDHNLVVLSVIPDEVIVVLPKDIDEMGFAAHLLGNLHKPVQIENGTIVLLHEALVEDALRQHAIAYEVKKMPLDKPLMYADLSHSHAK